MAARSPSIPTDKGTEAAAAAFLKWLALQVFPGDRATHLVMTNREWVATVGQDELVKLLDAYLLKDPPTGG